MCNKASSNPFGWEHSPWKQRPGRRPIDCSSARAFNSAHVEGSLRISPASASPTSISPHPRRRCPAATTATTASTRSRISDELGGEEAYPRMSDALRRHGIGQIVDIVPNHLAANPRTPGGATSFSMGVTADSPTTSTSDGETASLSACLSLAGYPGTALAKGELRVEHRLIRQCSATSIRLFRSRRIASVTTSTISIVTPPD